MERSAESQPAQPTHHTQSHDHDNEHNAHAHMHNSMHAQQQQQQQHAHHHPHVDLHGGLSLSHDGQSSGSEVDAATSAGVANGGSGGGSSGVSLSLSSSPPGMAVSGSRSDGNVSLSSAGLSSPQMSSAASSPASAAVAPSNGGGGSAHAHAGSNGGAINGGGAPLPIIGSASSVSSGSDDGTILFVGDLSRSVREEELAALFAPFGTLQAIDIKRDRLTQNNLGYGFVQLATRAEATRAKKALHAFELHGRKIRIGLAKKNTTLFIGDLDGSINTAQLVRAFEPFGHIVVEETFVKQPSGKYGFVRFATREDAERAKNEMNHKMLGSRPIRIGWGDSNFEKQCVHVQFEPSAVSLTTGASVNAVFDDAFFQSTFQPFASACNTAIVNISLPRHNHTKKLKGFAFCHYEENEAGEKAAVLALQTLTGQFQQTPVAQHLQSANGNANSADAMFGHQQQQQQQGQGNQFDGGSNVQTHLLGGVPCRFSFGKRQIFSRHRRANENAAAMGANGVGVGGAGGVGSPHGLGSPLVQSQGAMGLQQMAAMMGQMQSMMGLGGVANASGHMQAGGGGGGGHGPHHHGHNHSHHGGAHHGGGGHGGHNGGHGRNHGGGRYGGHGGGGGGNRHHMYQQQQQQQQSALGAQQPASMYNNAAAFLPYMQQLQSQQSPQQSPQLHGLHANNRYHTNPQQSFHAHSPLHSHAQTGAPQAAAGQQHSPVGVHHDSAGQVSAAAATSWMIQNLAAQQYAQGLAPLSVQQVQQAYQQMQQQQQQQQTPQSHSGVGVGVGTLAGSPYLDLSSASPPAVALDSSDANLASAANAFFNAQSQFYSQQQQQQQQQQSQAPASVGGSHLSLTLSPQQQSLHQPHHHHTLSHPSAHSMAQLMSEMSSLGLGMSAAAQQQQQQQQQGGPGSPPMHSQQSAQLITSGHSSAATSPTHAANSHALQQFYAHQQQQQQQQQQPFNKILQ